MWSFKKVISSGEMREDRDNGGRRSGIDRRYYSYSGHIPERRSGADRREKNDRRQYVSTQPDSERRKAFH